MDPHIIVLEEELEELKAQLVAERARADDAELKLSQCSAISRQLTKAWEAEKTRADKAEEKISATRDNIANASPAEAATKAGAEKRRITPDGYTKLPNRMVLKLGVAEKGGRTWFVLSQHRWQAWPEDELEEYLKP